MGVVPLEFRRCELIDAPEPELSGKVVARKIVAEVVGPVALEPGFLIEISQQRIGLADVLHPPLDFAQLPGSLCAVLLFVESRSAQAAA
jgi:hypothetical protein